MSQISKLKTVIKEWEDKAADLSKKADFCREHNFELEAKVLYEKRGLIEEICREIRLKVIEQLINM